MKKESLSNDKFHIVNLDSHEHARKQTMRTYKYPFFSFAFLIEGEVLVELDGKNTLIGPGQLMLVPENKTIFIHYYKDCVGYDGYFHIDFLKDASYPALRSQQPTIQSFWFDDAVFIAALMKRMLTAFEDKDLAFLQSAMDLILGQIRPGGHAAVIPEKFLQLVFNKDQAPLTVSEYADMMHVTANYLNKNVKTHTHRTAMEWVEIARLNQAKKLLKDPTVPIVEIAARCGLADQSYFARFFKKKTGLTPTQYRFTE